MHVCKEQRSLTLSKVSPGLNELFWHCTIIQGVSKKVNSLKNYSKLKRVKYLVKILFKLDKLTSCLPPVAKSLMCDNQ